MLQQSQARIFLSSQRAEIQEDGYRSSSCINENFFGNVSVFDDVTLAGEKSCKIGLVAGQYFVIIPLVGTIHFENTDENNLVNPGEALFISTDTVITNPYSDELVNFLRIAFAGCPNEKITTITCFDIDAQKNQLVGIGTPAEKFPLIKIGKFHGRAETLHHLQSKSNGTFVYVIAGAFEVQYRLLEAKDSLAVWDTETLELEALSNEAILLVIETQLTAEPV